MLLYIHTIGNHLKNSVQKVVWIKEERKKAKITEQTVKTSNSRTKQGRREKTLMINQEI